MAVSTVVSGLAVTPGTPYSLHVTAIELPPLHPSSVQIRVLEAGICGTDREIIHSTWGVPPAGSIDLVIGHEVLGEVEALGSDVNELAVGDLVSATVRRGCGCPQCAAGESDYCTTLNYTERGIRGAHGYMTERFVEDADWVVKLPGDLRSIGVLVEPLSVVEKAWRVATAVQARIPKWQAKTAVVYGAGPIGLLQAMMLRVRGLDVYVLARRSPSEAPAAAFAQGFGATYLSTLDHPIEALANDLPNVDVIVECSGSTARVADGMQLLGVAGVLVLLSNTGRQEPVTLPLDKINGRFVGGNRTMVGSVNSSVADFRAAIDDLAAFERLWPGLTARMITHRLSNLIEGVGLMESTAGAIKAIIEL